MARRKIVDAHHHLWELSQGYRYPWLQDERSGEGLLGDLAPIVRDYLVEDYLVDAGDYDVVGSVHVEAVPVDPLLETGWLVDLGGPLPSGIVAAARLDDPDAEKTFAAQSAYAAVRGIRQIVNWHPNPALSFTPRDLLADETFRSNYGLLSKFGFSFDMQLYPGQMSSAATLARSNPNTLMIVNHTGMPTGYGVDAASEWRDGMKRLAAEDNVVVKISGLGMLDHGWSLGSIRPFVLQAIDLFGVDRVMFGSNFPVDSLYSSFSRLFRSFEEIVGRFSEDEKDKMFRANALAHYRL